jgi:hypothetical protein
MARVEKRIDATHTNDFTHERAMTKQKQNDKFSTATISNSGITTKKEQQKEGADLKAMNMSSCTFTMWLRGSET